MELTANTDTDPARIEDVLASMPSLRGRQWLRERCRTGITNENWVVRSEDRAYFVKLHDPDEPREQLSSAVAAATLAAKAGIGAPLVDVDTERGVEVYLMLEGYRACTADDVKSHVARTAIATLYAKLQSMSPLLPVSRSGFTLLAERLENARRVAANMPGDLAAMLALCERGHAGIVAAGMRIVPSHNDSHLGNVLIGPDGDLKLIDWDYAANNDAYWDVAMFTSASLMDAEATEDFARRVLGFHGPAVEARLHVYRFVICISWGIWASTQAQTSAIPFDYAAHAAMIFDAARAMMADPMLEAHLCQL